MSAVAVYRSEERAEGADMLVAEALEAFRTDVHYLEDMVRVAQRIAAKRALRDRSLATA